MNVLGGIANSTDSLDNRTITTVKIGESGRFIYDPTFLTLTNKLQPYDTAGNLTVSIA